MYLYIKAANSYRYQDQQQKLEHLVRDYVEGLRQAQGLSRSQLNSRIPALSSQRKHILDLIDDLEQDQKSKYDAMKDIIDSGLGDIPAWIKEQLGKYGISGEVVPMNNLKFSDFWVVNYRGRASFQTTIVPNIEMDLPTGQWWTLPGNLADALTSQISRIVQRAGVTMCNPAISLYLKVSEDNYRRHRDAFLVFDSRKVDSDHAILYIHIDLNIGRGSQTIYDLMYECSDREDRADIKGLSVIDSMVVKGKVPRAKAKYASSEWNKTIDLRDYFPEECFDEAGNFDESLASEDDWITFNLYEVQNGFGDTSNLYSAVLTKAGFPVYPQQVSDPIVDNDGNLEFIMYGDEGLGVPDIRFGFDMDISGSKAKIVLAYAEVV